MKKILKKAIIALAKGDQQEAADHFRNVISAKARMYMTVTEAGADRDIDPDEAEPAKETLPSPKETPPVETPEIPVDDDYNFGLSNKSNIDITRAKMKARGLKFEEEKDKNITYFIFSNKKELDKGLNVAERYISKSKE